VVAERVVLLRVEDFEQRGGRVAAEVRAELVYLVEHHDGVVDPGAAQGLDDAAGKRADVGAAVAAKLRLVAHAAQREPLELAAEGACDGAAQGCLADARRADEAEDGALRVAAQLDDGEEFEDALLDLFEAVVVLVEYAPRLR
jgi:hypothetical protein